MVPITFSHGWNVLAKLVGALAVTCLLMLIAAFVEFAPLWLRQWFAQLPEWMKIVAMAVLFLGPPILAWFLLYRRYVVPAGNWLFLRYSRKTRIPWSDCVRLSPLFVPDAQGAWCPVLKLPDLLEEQRLPHLYRLAEARGLISAGEAAQLAGRYVLPGSPAATIPSEMPSSAAPSVPAPQLQPVSSRAAGALLFAIGLALGCWGVLSPLRAAAARMPKISLHLETVVLVPFGVIYGGLLLALGKRAGQIFGIERGQQPTRLGWFLIGAMVVFGFLLYAGLKLLLAWMGYDT